MKVLEMEIFRLTIIIQDITYSSNKDLTVEELLVIQEKQNSITESLQTISRNLEMSQNKITKALMTARKLEEKTLRDSDPDFSQFQDDLN
jgi:hypothetical protein